MKFCSWDEFLWLYCTHICGISWTRYTVFCCSEFWPKRGKLVFQEGGRTCTSHLESFQSWEWKQSVPPKYSYSLIFISFLACRKYRSWIPLDHVHVPVGRHLKAIRPGTPRGSVKFTMQQWPFGACTSALKCLNWHVTFVWWDGINTEWESTVPACITPRVTNTITRSVPWTCIRSWTAQEILWFCETWRVFTVLHLKFCHRWLRKVHSSGDATPCLVPACW